MNLTLNSTPELDYIHLFWCIQLNPNMHPTGQFHLVRFVKWVSSSYPVVQPDRFAP